MYPDETEQIPTLASVDLKSSQQMYENSESNLGEQQHCIEINHPESVEDIEQIYVQFNLQLAEGGSHYEEEDLQRYFDLQQKVFPYSFIDPFVDYMESLSSSNVRLFLTKEGCLFLSAEMNLHIPWSPLCIISRSVDLPVGSIKSSIDFWIILEKTEFRADIFSIKNFKAWSDMSIDENFSFILSSYLMSNSESEVIFLKEFAEKEIEALEVKIQELSFQSSFQLSFDIRIENNDEFDSPKRRKWYDPIDEYIKESIDSGFQYTLNNKSENQNYRQMMIVVPVFILCIHRSCFSLCMQILVWLHWKHDVT